MQANDPSEDVQKFLRDRIESYEQLELLLLLRSERDHPWKAGALSARLGIPASLTLLALDRLQSAGLVEARALEAEKQYACVAQNDDVDATIGRLVQAYREHPVPIIKLMSANAIERVRTAALRAFADAFLLRKDKNAG